MGTRLIGILAFITFIHFGARAAAPATVLEISDLPTPTALPAELDHLVDMEAGCSLMIVFDPTCPACASAAELQSEQLEVPLELIWLAADEDARALYERRVHREARIEVVPEAYTALQVRAVPAAFVVSAGTVLSGSTISGTEDLSRVAARCTASAEG